VVQAVVRVIAAVILLALLGCAREAEKSGASETTTTLRPKLAAWAERAEGARDGQAERSCLDLIAKLERELPVPSVPLGRDRAELLGRAKAEPVIFVRAPRLSDVAEPAAELYRRQIERSKTPGYTLHQLYKDVRRQRSVARAVLLREGYLYAESPGMGATLVSRVELGHLFDDPELVIERGSRRFTARRAERAEYEYVGGAEAGERANILLFDRVWPAKEIPSPPLHRDLPSMARELGFDRAEIERIDERYVVARLRYGTLWVKTVLVADGARLSLQCEAIPAGAGAAVTQARELTLRRERAVSMLRRAVDQMIHESLPFDEPKTEDGQQDGNLRPKWRFAYLQGWETYEFNDDRYFVFDGRGRPRVPQVCVDFIMDALERASGTWWRERGSARERVRGRLDFDEFGIDNRRSVERFIDFAERHPQWFDVHHLSREERIPLWRRREFFDHLHAEADRYSPGDVVAIHGLRDDEEYHYHSFFVLASDPVTGVPTRVAANAGRPRIRAVYDEMVSAPKRSFKTRVRPRLEWLETILLEDSVAVAAPAAGLQARRP
jgi:hypothetical protein